MYDRTNNAQGETIKMQDPANLPKYPVAPKRRLLTALGMALGLAIGLFLAALLEIPRVLKIQNIEDAKHYTGLPILASVPPLLNPTGKNVAGAMLLVKGFGRICGGNCQHSFGNYLCCSSRAFLSV